MADIKGALCPSCGFKQDAGGRYCIACGEPMGAGTQSQPEATARVEFVPDVMFRTRRKWRPGVRYWLEVGGRRFGRLTGERVSSIFRDYYEKRPVERIGERIVHSPGFLTYDDKGASWWLCEMGFYCERNGLPLDRAAQAVYVKACEVKAREWATMDAESDENWEQVARQVGMPSDQLKRMTLPELANIGVRLGDQGLFVVADEGDSGRSRLRRTAIPDDVKIFVWRRDEGRCVRCGSNERLEFDHIIPRSKGGSDTARNLQLLCEPCNRAKGGNLA